MKDKYTATTHIYVKLSDNTYSKIGLRNAYVDNDITKLKNRVAELVIRKTARLDCCVTILYEKNGEYYDSEEIFIENGKIV